MPLPRAPSGVPGRVGVALLIATMLLVPIGFLWAGRSLAPALERLASLAGATASAVVEVEAGAEVAGARGLRVKVSDGDGNPVAGAAVRLVEARPPFGLLGEARTDLSGASSFVSVPRSSVRVIASHERDGVVTSTDLAVPDGGALAIELALSTADAITGTVVDEDEHPVAGATLAVEGMPWAIPQGVASDAQGSFRLVTVPHEAATLVVVARGYKAAKASLAARSASSTLAELALQIKLVAAPPVHGDVTDPDGSPVRGRILACEGEPAEAETTSTADGAFELPPSVIGCGVVALNDGYAASETVVATDGQRLALRLRTGGGIEGVVVDDRGSAVSPFVLGIEAFSAARGKSLRTGNQRTFDEARGAFRWDKLAPGTYVLTASATGKPPTRSEPIEVAAGATTRGVRIVLARGGVVKGHVTDDKHAPIAGADVTFDQMSSAVQGGARTKTDEAGAFVLEGAPSGPFTVRVDKSGFRMRMIAGLTVASGATLTEDVTLTPSDGTAKLELGGIGATIGQVHGGIEIASVFPGDPAERAGLRGGDTVIRIDGEATDSMSVADALQRLRGEPGTTVGVSVQRGGAGPGAPRETFDAVVVRAAIVH